MVMRSKQHQNNSKNNVTIWNLFEPEKISLHSNIDKAVKTLNLCTVKVRIDNHKFVYLHTVLVKKNKVC